MVTGMAETTMVDSGVPDRQSALAVHQRIEQLLATIQPNKQSEFRRLTIANYVIGLIKSCFVAGQVEAFMFGSVPLRTYLPDGDIDISVFSSSRSSSTRGDVGMPSLRDSWANQLLRALEAEKSRQDAPFRIRDLQIIQAEVKLVKCVVADLVVDVSFESLGGLCTVAFLESIDRQIGRAHLFKRSIVLVKAWCYYESRLLGAHHGLISSYALEAMVLYVFNLHHKELSTPMEVLCKFLDVFSAFNWDEYCLSLQGPIPLNTFPVPAVDTHGIDSSSLLLDPSFLEDVLAKYSVQPTHGPPPSPAQFVLKHLNIVDPLLPSNNLGRSVSKASFARIRRAFAHGAHALGTILRKDPANAIEGIDLFFKNTWKSPMRMAADNQAFMQQLGLGNLPYPMSLAPAYSAPPCNSSSELAWLVQPPPPPPSSQRSQQQKQPTMGRTVTSQPQQQLASQQPIPEPHYLQMLNDAMRQHRQRQQQEQQAGPSTSGAAAGRSQLEALAQSLQLLQMQQCDQNGSGSMLQYPASLYRPPTAPPSIMQQQQHQQREARRLERRHSFGSVSFGGNSKATSPAAASSIVSGSGYQSQMAPLAGRQATELSSPTTSPPPSAVRRVTGEATARESSGVVSSGKIPSADMTGMLQAHQLQQQQQQQGPSQAASPSIARGSNYRQQNGVPSVLENGMASGVRSPSSEQHSAAVRGPIVASPLPATAALRPGARQLPGGSSPLSEEAISALLAGGLHAGTAPNTPATPAAMAAAAAATAALQAQTIGTSQPRPPAAAQLSAMLGSHGGLGSRAGAAGMPRAGAIGVLTPYQLQLLAAQPQLLQTFLATQTDVGRTGAQYWFAQQPIPTGARLSDGHPAEEPPRSAARHPTSEQQPSSQVLLLQQPQQLEHQVNCASRSQQASPALSPSGSGEIPAGQPADIFTGDLLSLSQNLSTARSCQLQEKAQASGDADPVSRIGSAGSECEGRSPQSSSSGVGSPAAPAGSPPTPAQPNSPADKVEAARVALPAVRTSSNSAALVNLAAAAATGVPPPAADPGSCSAASVERTSARSTPVTTPSCVNLPRQLDMQSPTRSAASSAAPAGSSAASTPNSSRMGERPPWGRPVSSGASTPTAPIAPPSRRSWSDIAASGGKPRGSSAGSGSAGRVPQQAQQQPQLQEQGRGSGESRRPLQERFVARLSEGKGAGSVRRGGSSAAGGSSRAPSEVSSDQGGTPRAAGSGGARRRGPGSLKGNGSKHPSTWSLAEEEFPSLGSGSTPGGSPVPAAPARTWGAKRDQTET